MPQPVTVPRDSVLHLGGSPPAASKDVMVQKLGVWEGHPESVGHPEPSALRAAQKYFVKGKREETGQEMEGKWAVRFS